MSGRNAANAVYALSNDNGGQSEDLLLQAQYWAARSGEARARLEECLAIARLHINIDTALNESKQCFERLEAALEYSPVAKEKLMGGELF